MCTYMLNLCVLYLNKIVNYYDIVYVLNFVQKEYYRGYIITT